MYDRQCTSMSELLRILRRAVNRPSRPTGMARRGLRPALEGLERRSLLAMMYVNTTTVVVGSSTSIYGQPVAFTATVTPQVPGSPTPT